MIYNIDTVPEDTTVYGFAYKFFNHDTNRLFTAVPTMGVVKNHSFFSDKDGFDPDNQFDGSETDSTPAYIFNYADTIQEATVAYNDLVCNRMEWLGDLLKKASDDLCLEC